MSNVIQSSSDILNASSGFGGSWTSYHRQWEEGGTYALGDATATLHISVKYGDTILVFAPNGHTYFTFTTSDSDIDPTSTTLLMSHQSHQLGQYVVPPGMKVFNIMFQTSSNFNNADRLPFWGVQRHAMIAVV